MRVVVVGAGVIGVATAYFLARHGCDVTVLEREPEAAAGTSHANAGMLTPSMADPWNAPGLAWHLLRWLGREDAPFLLRPSVLPSMAGWGLKFLRQSTPARFRANSEKNLRLALYSLEQLRALRADLKLPYDALANGTIKVFRDARGFADGQSRTQMLTAMGLQVRTLTPAQAVALEPSLAPVQSQLVGAIHCPQDESGDARAFTEGLAARAREFGVEFHFGAEVTGVERSGDRIAAVLAGGARYTADSFVLAAGCWSPRFLQQFGARLPLQPVKGYSITVDASGWSGAPRMPVIDDALHAAVTPLGSRLRIAGTAELAGFDRSLNPARIENLFHLLLSLFPGFAPRLDRARASPWAGLRPVSADGVPHLGRFAMDNLFLNTGHGHLGWTLAAGSAQLVADLVAGKRPGLDLEPYDPNRRS